MSLLLAAEVAKLGGALGAGLAVIGAGLGIGRIGAILAPTIAGQLLDIGWDKQSLYVGVGFVMLISTVALFFLKSRSEIKT